MDIYIERPNAPLTLDEWREYVQNDKDLVLEESAAGIHPLTKQALRIESPGRTLYNGSEISYKNGRIGTDDGDDDLIRKLRQIAEALGARVFDCGEEI